MVQSDSGDGTRSMPQLLFRDAVEGLQAAKITGGLFHVSLSTVYRIEELVLGKGFASVKANASLQDRKNVKTIVQTVFKSRNTMVQDRHLPELHRVPLDSCALTFQDFTVICSALRSGGAGSVILCVNTRLRQAELVWFACMSYRNAKTTNNVAEYWGLVHGLQHAATHRLGPLHVVGDSQLILRQVRENRLPKATHLQPLNRRARRLAQELGIRSWTHHLRAHNKMADAAANVAMSSRCSIQPTQDDARGEQAHILQHLDSDIQHWFNRIEAQQQSSR